MKEDGPEAVLRFLDDLRAAETAGAEVLAAWIAVCGLAGLRGGLRASAPRRRRSRSTPRCPAAPHGAGAGRNDRPRRSCAARHAAAVRAEDGAGPCRRGRPGCPG